MKREKCKRNVIFTGFGVFLLVVSIIILVFKSQKDNITFIKGNNPKKLKNNPFELYFAAIEEIYGNVFFTGNKYDVKNIEKFLHKYHTTFEVKELQNFALDTLCEFDKFCKENNLKYNMSDTKDLNFYD